MDWLFGWITDWIKQGLIDAITGQFTGIFESVNNQVTDVAAQVGQTPQGWNGGVFSMIQTLSETVVLPIAGMILTFVLVYELIQMILEKNNMHEFDTFNIFKWVFKTFVATYLLTNCFTIVMAVFDVAQTVVANSAGIINGNLDVAASMADLETQLQAMGIWELIGLWLETNIINLCMWILSIVIFVIVYGRMIEIYLTVSIAPIPFSTRQPRMGSDGDELPALPVRPWLPGIPDPDLCCDLCGAGTIHPIFQQRAWSNLGYSRLYGAAGLCPV